MIVADEVIPLLLAAVPGLHRAWQDLEADGAADDEGPAGRLHFVDAGNVAGLLVDRQRSGDTAELSAAFAVIERLYAEGDDEVRELATIGYLEGIQNLAGHAGLDPEVFVRYLGPQSLRWWRGLDRFWSGGAPRVLPTD